MDKETLINKIKEIDSIEDGAERREKLTELTEEVGNIFDTYNTTLEQDQKLKEENEKLIEYNRKLFMKVGMDKTPEQIEKDTTGSDPMPEPRRYENLFDDKGNLK